MPTKPATKTTAKKSSRRSAATTVDVTFEFERSTKNTHRFHETSDEPLIGTLYVQQSAFPDGAPETLTVTLTF